MTQYDYPGDEKYKQITQALCNVLIQRLVTLDEKCETIAERLILDDELTVGQDSLTAALRRWQAKQVERLPNDGAVSLVVDMGYKEQSCSTSDGFKVTTPFLDTIAVPVFVELDDFANQAPNRKSLKDLGDSNR